MRTTMHGTSAARRWQHTAVTGALIGVFALAGCTSGSTSRAAGTTTPAPKTTLAPTSPTCRSAKDLESAQSALQKLSTFTPARLQAAVDQITTSLDNVKPTFHSSTDRASVAELEGRAGALEHAINVPGSKGLSMRAATAENVVTFATPVLDALRSVCPAS